jgi:hypothetical protein
MSNSAGSRLAYRFASLGRDDESGHSPSTAEGLFPLAFLIYFALIGTAFMLTEICLIQQFILFLARPAHAFSVVLFSVLVASGLGSYCSKGAVLRGERGELQVKNLAGGLPVLVIAPVLLVAYMLFMDKLLMTTMAWPLWLRHGFAFLVIFPAGFVMGMFFPIGLRILSARHRAVIPWAWAVNASVSVVGSVLAVVIALSWGFVAVLFVAAVAYGVAVVCLPFMERRAMAS